MTVRLASADWAVLGVYFAAVLAIGFAARRRSADAADFLLAGRTLTLPLFVMTLVSTWYGGILGVGEYSYRYGISNWIVQGVPYYLFAALFAFLLAGRIRKSNLTTIPDKLAEVHGPAAARAGALLTFVLTTPAPYVLMLAVLLNVATGIPIEAGLLLGTAAATVYLATGGFRADVWTDVFEFAVMFLGFAVIVPFAVLRFGGAGFLTANLPPAHLTWDGGEGVQYVLVWFFIALWTLVDPAFHQRCYAAKSPAVARRGILLSIPFWFVFDAMTAAAGLYARAALPDLSEPMMAYPMLAEAALPAGLKGMFYAGMLATIMSTLNSLFFISATTLGRDLPRTFGRRGDPAEVRGVRWSLLGTAALSIALALAVPSVVRLWYTIGTLCVPGLLLPLLTAYFPRFAATPRRTTAAMWAGPLMSLGWMLAGRDGIYPGGIEPMVPGMAAVLVIWASGRRPAASSTPEPKAPVPGHPLP
jgi:SSS family solute:Na+ symporter